MTTIDRPETQDAANANGATSESAAIPLALPEPSTRAEQDAEWCLVRIDGQWREIRFHDYGRIYDVPGLYERLFYDVLKSSSPKVVCGLLREEMLKVGEDPRELRVLDVGAGNGIVGEQLVKYGAQHLIGLDILPEAAAAARRDRPSVYAEYFVCDLTDLSRSEHDAMAAHRPNSLACVAALGFGDIPPEAFRVAFNLVTDGGWIAFTLKEDFLSGRDSSGFSKMVDRAITEGPLELRTTRRYPHRLAAHGDPLHYVAMVGTKRGDIPAEMVARNPS